MRYESKPASNGLWDPGKNWLHHTWELPKGNDIRPTQNRELAIQTCSICLVPFWALVQLATRFGPFGNPSFDALHKGCHGLWAKCLSFPLVLAGDHFAFCCSQWQSLLYLFIFGWFCLCVFSTALAPCVAYIYIFFKSFLVCGPRGTRWEDDGMGSTVLRYGHLWWTLLTLSTVILKNGVTCVPESTGTASAWL